jgi:uncharacterized membrane protein YkoI
MEHSMRLMPIVLALGFSLGFAAPAAAYVDIETVRAMAFDRGIVRLDEIELRRKRGVWEVEGEDAYGNDIEMKVDALTGRIIKMERD